MSQQLLPESFAALQPFVAHWAVATSAERAALRDGATAAECQAIYDAVLPIADDALDYLDGRDVSNLSQEDENLMRVLLAATHASLVVEVQGRDEMKHSKWRSRMCITQTPADPR